MWTARSRFASSMNGLFCISVSSFHSAPNLFEISELCILGLSTAILRLWMRDQTMKAFIGRLMCGSNDGCAIWWLPWWRWPRASLLKCTASIPGGAGNGYPWMPTDISRAHACYCGNTWFFGRLSTEQAPPTLGVVTVGGVDRRGLNRLARLLTPPIFSDWRSLIIT
jgi:hypothetical protein